MAIEKGVVGQDGVAVNYHRIVTIRTFVNRFVVIEVASYVNKKYRQNQIDFKKAEAQGQQPTVAYPYILTRYYELPYTENVTISGAYEYLKTLPEFEGAVDVWDDDDQAVTDGEEANV